MYARLSRAVAKDNNEYQRERRKREWEEEEEEERLERESKEWCRRVQWAFNAEAAKREREHREAQLANTIDEGTIVPRWPATPTHLTLA